MRRLLVPGMSCEEAALVDGEWIEMGDARLGGYFYDFLRNSNSLVVGIRYYLFDRIDFDLHELYKCFSSDGRFRFNQAQDFIDIFFDEKSAKDSSKNILYSDGAQYFGGVQLVSAGSSIGILIES